MSNPLPQLREVAGVPNRVCEGIGRAVRQIAATGTWWTGEQRVAIAAIARSAQAGEAGPSHGVVSEVVSRAAETVAVDAHSVTAQSVDDFEGAGFRPEAFVEIVGVVARITAVDTTVRGIGAAPVSFPEPVVGGPTMHVEAGAKRRSAYVPMVGGAGATNALSAVSAEDWAQEDLHGALYLTYAEMGDLSIVKGLPRWQLELIAARTSLINECFF